MKREGASTLFIHGYPWALSYLFISLVFAFPLFEMVFMCGFERCFEKEAIVVATFVMILV